MKQCPMCKEEFADVFAFCPIEGTPLRPLRIEAQAENLPQLSKPPFIEESPQRGEPKREIFISYRREDSEADTGRLCDSLSNHFGQDHIFIDVDVIELGEDYAEVIKQGVVFCDILIVVIGKNWLTITDSSGNRRLDNHEDFLKLEIAMALNCDIPVIPVLVQGASMPQSKELPEALSKLARRNAVELNHKRWRHDIDQLIRAIERRLGMSTSLPK